MPFRRLVLLVPSLAAALACGGLGASVPVREHLDRVCVLSGAVVLPPDLDLVTVDVPAVAVEKGIQIDVRSDGLRLDGTPVDRTTLPERLGNGGGPALVLVAADVEAASVVDLIGALHTAGVSRVSFVARSKEPLEVPPFPDPAFAAELSAELAETTPSDRAMILAQRISDEVRLCPGAGKVFSAVSNADPSQTCAMIAVGLEEELPICVLTDVDRVVTAVQVAVQPTDPMRPTVVALDLDPAGVSLGVAPSLPWRDLLPKIVADPTVRWLTVE